MDPVSIEYRIKLGEKRVENFQFQLDGKTFDLITGEIPDLPKWTELSFRQCPHCPLNPIEHSHCPMAVQLLDIVERFTDADAVDVVELEVVTGERRVIQTLALQNAIASMLDLVVPACRCPKTAFMKPLARFHLPSASEEETVFRVTGMYLLSQYFLSQTSGDSAIEFDGLTRIYEDLHLVNTAITSRLQGVTHSDSLKNAIALVERYSVLVPALLEDQLKEMRGFFQAYLPQADAGSVTTRHLDEAREFGLELVPIDNGSTEAGERPDWLQELTVADEPAEAEVMEAAKPEDTATQSETDKVGFGMELEPVEEETLADPVQIDSAASETPESEERTPQLAPEVLEQAGFDMELEPLDEEMEEDADQKTSKARAVVEPGEERGESDAGMLERAGLEMELEPMDEVTGEGAEQETVETRVVVEPSDEKKKQAASVVDTSTLSMELEPMDGAIGDVPDHSKPSRAVFKLPDD